ncbi:MAG: protein phosphatase 2C domain-containing protein [Clostridiales bacterium]|nr:protein phosphatase 2C domain-containing protein [Clostridiales bacterium]
MIGIYIKTYSKVGEYHRSKGNENEDAYRILVNGDYVYCMVSDGAGSSAYAKEAAWCTIEVTADFCYGQGADFFGDHYNCAAKRLIFDVQQALFEKANEQNTDLSQMMCTLVLLAINTKTKQYVTVHVGDGLIAATQQQQTQILSYPENGPTKQYTYMVNSPNVMKHLRIKSDTFESNTEFFVCTDGVTENCYSTNQYKKRVKMIKNCNLFDDDATYCLLR